MEIRISVRNLVEFILRSGNIDNRRSAVPDNAMQEGGRIHRMIQRRMGVDYHAEVPLSFHYQTEEYTVIIEGRADGIIIPLTAAMPEAVAASGVFGAVCPSSANLLVGSDVTLRGDSPAGCTATSRGDSPAGCAATSRGDSPAGCAATSRGDSPVGCAATSSSDSLPDNPATSDNLPLMTDDQLIPVDWPPADPATTEQVVTIDEIKGTYRDVTRMKEPAAVHIAQAKCYAYFYAERKKQRRMRVRMTYCNIETEELKYFYQEFSYGELRRWFDGVMAEYRKWTDYECAWRKKRLRSIKEMDFPFPYRDGQKELVTYVYQTIYHKRKLYMEAPTGVGKTISTVFPAIKAMGEGMGEKVFYLTAKTITRTVAEEAFSLLRERGLQFKTVILTAKDKICFREETECNPLACPYANGHYDRINEALFALLTEADSFTRENIEAYAARYRVCPFEMCLDMSLFADGVICDYNYVFDPHVYLKRFFAEGIRGSYLFLVDEAHNLVDRGREMYSAVLRKEDFLALKRLVREIDEQMARLLDRCNKELLIVKRECDGYQTDPFLTPFMQALARLATAMDKYLEEHETSPVRKEILEFYFEICHFQAMNELLDDNYVVYSQVAEDGSFFVKLFCVNPTVNLRECMMRARSTVLFSATLLPIQYYKKLLGGMEGDYDVYARSVFQPERRGLFIAGDVTSKYSRRNDEEYYNIARYLYEIVKNRHGNYMIFFPSHMFLQKVYERYMEFFWVAEEAECILQTEHMNEPERELFLARFAGNAAEVVSGAKEVCPPRQNRVCVKETKGSVAEVSETEEVAAIPLAITEEARSLLGFCVSGGIFSEGIDLKNDSLIGAIIVGTGLPQVCPEREIVKCYFDQRGENGFDYAYKLPGMNKVLQAAGRVIRTQEDIGIVVLLDERFQNQSYRRLFPKEWENHEIVRLEQVAGRVEKFWNDWL